MSGAFSEELSIYYCFVALIILRWIQRREIRDRYSQTGFNNSKFNGPAIYGQTQIYFISLVFHLQNPEKKLNVVWLDFSVYKFAWNIIQLVTLSCNFIHDKSLLCFAATSRRIIRSGRNSHTFFSLLKGKKISFKKRKTIYNIFV